MSIVDRNTVKSYFNRGDQPTEAQFVDTFDSEVSHFPSMQDLVDASVAGNVDNQVFILKDFYSSTKGGGGIFYWDASEPKANHDGGLVIDPNHSSTPGQSGWWSSENTGSGCFKRHDTGYAFIEWFGGIGDNTDVTSAFNAANQASEWIRFGEGEFQLDNVDHTSNRNILVSGSGPNTIIRAVTDYAFNIQSFALSNQDLVVLEDFKIDGESKTKSGIYQKNQGITLNNVVISGCEYGVRRLGSFTNAYNNCNISLNKFGVYAEGESGTAFHTGLDSFYRTKLRINDVGLYLDGNGVGNGGTTRLDQCYIESNYGFGIFVKGFQLSNRRPLQIESTWFEGNGRDATMTINGTSYDTEDVDIYAEGPSDIAIYDTYLNKVTTVGEVHLHVDGSSLFSLNEDGQGIYDFTRLMGDDADVGYRVKRLTFYRDNRAATSKDVYQREELYSDYNNLFPKGSNCFDTSFDIASGKGSFTTVNDGLFPQNKAIEFTITDATGNFSDYDFADRPNVTTGKFYVITCALKKVSGNLTNIDFNFSNASGIVNTTFDSLEQGVWVTYKTIFKAENTDTPYPRFSSDDTGVVRMSKFQIVEFDTKEEAVNFTEKDIYAIDQNYIDNSLYRGEKADALNSLTDNTGGSSDDTIAAILGSGADSDINNNFADLAAKINEIRTNLINANIMKS